MRGTKKIGKGRFRPLCLLLSLIRFHPFPLLVPCMPCPKRKIREEKLLPCHYVALAYVSSVHPFPLLLSSFLSLVHLLGLKLSLALSVVLFFLDKKIKERRPDERWERKDRR